jgi:hypothetical protein
VHSARPSAAKDGQPAPAHGRAVSVAGAAMSGAVLGCWSAFDTPRASAL